MTGKVKSKSTENNNRLMIIIGMVAVAVVLIVGFIVFQRPTSALDYSNIPKERTEDGAFILGNPDAAITIVAWEDFLCPHCQAYEPELKRFFVDFVAKDRARFEFRMLPISDTSPLVFGLVECADTIEPGAFWDAHDVMFNIATAGFSNGSGRDFAEQMNMSYSELLNCAATANQVTTDQQLANSFIVNGQKMVTGTPSVGWRLNGSEVRFDIINRRPSYDELAALIKAYEGQ